MGSPFPDCDSQCTSWAAELLPEAPDISAQLDLAAAADRPLTRDTEDEPATAAGLAELDAVDQDGLGDVLRLAAEAEDSLVATAIVLLDSGLWPIAVGLDRKGEVKKPIHPDWQNKPPSPSELVDDLSKPRNKGVALVLGAVGQVIDFEIDDPSEAPSVLARIFGPDGPPPTLQWTSNRGGHWLYATTPEIWRRLSEAGVGSRVQGKRGRNGIVLGNAMYIGVEVRLGVRVVDGPGGQQTVVPPTIRKDESPRVWEGESIAMMPESLVNDLIANASSTRRVLGTRVPRPRTGDEGVSPLDLFLDTLDFLGRDYERANSGYMARCVNPAHPDINPSLSIAEGREGRLLLNCFGCGADLATLMSAVGLRRSDAFVGHEVDDAADRDRQLGSSHFGGRSAPSEPIDFANRAAGYAAALAAIPRGITRVAEVLGVSERSLLDLQVGWKVDYRLVGRRWVGTGRLCVTLPEFNGRDKVVGITRVYLDNKEEKAEAGGRRGLYLPRGWNEAGGPIFVVRSVLSVANLLAQTSRVIGCPAQRSIDDLVAMLKSEGSQVFVLYDQARQDELAERKWFASTLKQQLGDRVRLTSLD